MKTRTPRTPASKAAKAPGPPLPRTLPPDESPSQWEDEVRLRAYELYEQRGRRDGFAEEDWYDAEKEILARRGTIAA